MFKKNRPLITILLALTASTALAATLLGFWVYRNLGMLLVVADPVREVDVIFSFAGESQRLAYARDLQRQFPQAHWVVSVADSAAAAHIRRTYQPDSARTTFLYGATCTLDEVKALAAWLKTHRPKHVAVGLISSPWHMRRIWVLAKRFLFRWGWECRYFPVPDERYGENKVTKDDLIDWKSSGGMRAFVIYAWLETGFDFVRAFFGLMDEGGERRKTAATESPAD